MAALTTIALASIAVGVGVSAYGTIQAGKSAKRAEEFNAKVKENNAIRVEQEARENARRRRKENARFLSGQRASRAKSGVLTGEGTPLEVLAESAGILELEALDQERAAKMRADDLRMGAEMHRFQGQQASKASKISAAGTLISGAGTVASGYGQGKALGVF